MPNIACTNCGQKIAVPDDHARPKIRCGLCGYYSAFNLGTTPQQRKPEERTEVKIPVDDEEEENDENDGSQNYGIADPEKPKKKAEKKSSDSIKQKSGSERESLSRPGSAKAVKKVKNNEAEDPQENSTKSGRKARERTNPLDHRPDFETLDPEGPNLLEGDHIEHDGEFTSPYAVPGSGVKKCKECRGDLPIDATFCVHCGIEISTKTKKAKRTYSPIYREWEPQFKPDLRTKIFFGLVGINLIFVVISIFYKNPVAGVANLIVQTAVQAFLLGTFDKIIISRTPKGKVEVLRSWRVLFYPMQPTKVNWQASHATAITTSHNFGLFDWAIMIYLLFCCILPGVLFYWFVMRPIRSNVVLCDVHGAEDQTIFTTTDREIADEICTTISDVGGLSYRRIM